MNFLYTVTWMNLKNDMLSQRSQAQKNTYSYDSVYMKLKNKQN